MTETVDPRPARTAMIQGVGNRGLLAVGVQEGSPQALANAATTALCSAATRARLKNHEVRTSRLLDSEKAEKYGQNNRSLEDEMRKASATLRATNERVQAMASGHTVVKPYGVAEHHDASFDRDFLARFLAMSQSERAILIHRCTHEAETHRRWGEALQRLPRDLTGLTETQHDAMRWGMLKVFDPATHAMIATELTQCEQLRTAIQLSAQVLAEDAGYSAIAALTAASPEVAGALSESQ